jgi:hypothetical protein|tara:strand:- start:719 stop:910 length:192 start_codon:yes stop_codon:yes gene_type:complete
MKFEDAIKKSIKAFMRGKMPAETNGLNDDGIFFSPEYFDELEKTLLDDGPKSKKKKEPVDEDL